MNCQAQTPMLLGVAAAIVLAFSLNASAADADAAKMLARENSCFKCHGIEKPKDGPSWKEVADKYRGKAGAEERLIKHLTTGVKAKFPDGHEEEHKNIKDKASPEAIKNLVDFILSL